MSRFVASLGELSGSRVSDYFLENPESNHVVLGVASRLKRNSSARPIYVQESSDGKILGMALEQSGVVLVATFAHSDGVREFSALIRARSLGRLRELMGPASVTDVLWTDWKTDLELRGTQPHRLHRLDRLAEQPSRNSTGFRFATRKDQDWIREWMRLFSAEAFHPADDASFERSDAEVATLVQAGAFGVMFDVHDGRPVSIGAIRNTYDRYRRIVYVYTPEMFRGRGFAASLTWELSRWIQQESGGEAVLFTDISNETANRLYARLGFTPIADFGRYLFVPKSSLR